MLGLLGLKVLLGVDLEGVVLLEAVLVDFLVFDFLDEQFFELHLGGDQLLFDVAENARVDDPLSPEQ